MTARIFRKLGIALALTATSIAAIAPAQAHDYGNRDGWSRQGGYERGYDSYDRYRGYDRGYDARLRYDHGSYGYRGNYDTCRRDDGAAGTIIGAIAGGLIGSSAAGRHGDRTAGALIGGTIGAVAGHAIDRGSDRCR